MTPIKHFFIALFFSPLFVYAQDLNYAKEIVKTLASDEFYGRAYVMEGEKIAANYIQEEFEKIGLAPFKKSYFQKYASPVNTFPSKMSLSLNEHTLKAGADFIIEAGSPGIQGTFKTMTISVENIFDKQLLSDKLINSAGKFIIIPSFDKTLYDKEGLDKINDVINFIKFHPDNPAAGSIILTQEKLTWSGATSVNAKPSFTVFDNGNFEKIKEVHVDVENKFFKQYNSQNVIGYLEGARTDSFVVLIAHYDHLGMMGSEAIFPGANDNASGIAMLLNLAKYYKAKPPKFNIVFIAFGGEEIGLVGSQYFVENPLFDLDKIKFLLNFDISGTGDDGIQVVNGKQYTQEFEKLVALNEEHQLLKEVKVRGEACNSDHCMFHMQKVPSFFIYTLGGIKAYHDIYDKSETLPLTEFEDYFKLIQLFIDEL